MGSGRLLLLVPPHRLVGLLLPKVTKGQSERVDETSAVDDGDGDDDGENGVGVADGWDD